MSLQIIYEKPFLLGNNVACIECKEHNFSSIPKYKYKSQIGDMGGQVWGPNDQSVDLKNADSSVFA